MPIWGLWTQGLPLAFRGNHTNYCNLNSSAWLTFGIVKEMPFSRWRGQRFHSDPTLEVGISEEIQMFTTSFVRSKLFWIMLSSFFWKQFFASSHYQTKLNIHKLWSFEELTHEHLKCILGEPHDVWWNLIWHLKTLSMARGSTLHSSKLGNWAHFEEGLWHYKFLISSDLLKHEFKVVAFNDFFCFNCLWNWD